MNDETLKEWLDKATDKEGEWIIAWASYLYVRNKPEEEDWQMRVFLSPDNSLCRKVIAVVWGVEQHSRTIKRLADLLPSPFGRIA